MVCGQGSVLQVREQQQQRHAPDQPPPSALKRKTRAHRKKSVRATGGWPTTKGLQSCRTAEHDSVSNK